MIWFVVLDHIFIMYVDIVPLLLFIVTSVTPFMLPYLINKFCELLADVGQIVSFNAIVMEIKYAGFGR
jgi:hypothetical protein